MKLKLTAFFLAAIAAKNMTRKLVLLGFISFVLLLSACSYGYDFIVVNRSAGVVEVQYSLKPQPPGSGRYFNINPPAKVSLKEFEEAEYEWRNLPQEQYRFEDLTGTFTVSLDRGEVLRLDSVTNYSGDEDQFALASIKLRGANGSVDLEGRQAQLQFHKSETKYVLTYR